MSREKSRLRSECNGKAPVRDENFVLFRQFNRQERSDISVGEVGFFILQDHMRADQTRRKDTTDRMGRVTFSI